MIPPSTKEELSAYIATIKGLDSKFVDIARHRLSNLTKPEGSLGRVEELSMQIAGIRRTLSPSWQRKHVIVMVADHGVAVEQVSAYPQAVTIEMLRNFSKGGAAINVLARTVGADVTVVDVGTISQEIQLDSVIFRKIGNGTKNMLLGPAMSLSEAINSILTGILVFHEIASGGIDILITGDMGIGNTTASSAITSVICRQDPSDVTGTGTGITTQSLKAKIGLIRSAITKTNPDSDDPFDVLSKVGGFEIGAIAGTMLAAAAHRIPVVIDGFISGAAALIATSIAPNTAAFLIAGHCSTEPGHRILLDHLGLKPLLNLELRLGEGTGAALALPIVESSCRILSEMATFESAHVSRKVST